MDLRDNITFVYKAGLCCSCGLCSNFCSSQAIFYTVDSLGFYKPNVKENECINCGICVDNCPGINDLKNYTTPNLEEYFYGYSQNEEMRLNSASGGIITELLCKLILDKKVDYVTCVTTRTKEEPSRQILTNNITKIRSCRTSKYFPIVWDDIIEKIKKINGSVAVVALPCQVNSIKNYFKNSKQNGKIKFYISLLCNHTPSLHAADFITYAYNKKASLVSLVNRGGGWPGFMKYTVKLNGTEKLFFTPFRKTWAAGYGRYFKNLRCSVCNDPYSKNADIVAGDSYFLQDSDTKGTTYCIVRNKVLADLLKKMVAEKMIHLTEGPFGNIRKNLYKSFVSERENRFAEKNNYIGIMKHIKIRTTNEYKGRFKIKKYLGFVKSYVISTLGAHKILWPLLIKWSNTKKIFEENSCK